MPERRKQQRYRSLGGAPAPVEREKSLSSPTVITVAITAAALIVALWILGIISLFASPDLGPAASSASASAHRGGGSLRALTPSAPDGDGAKIESVAAPAGGRQPSNTASAPPVLLSRSPSVVVASDVTGNLGPPSVLNQDPPGPDWIKDRWQAASDMGGTAIKGAHWVTLDFGGDGGGARIGVINKVVLDWETAYADDYRLEVGFDAGGNGDEGGSDEGNGDGGGDTGGRRWTVLYDGSNAEHRRTMRHAVESGQSPGVKKKMPLHIVHTLGPFPFKNMMEGQGGRYVRVWIRKPARGWGVSLWQVDVYGSYI